MSFLTIQTDPTSLNYEQTVPLEGIEYIFRFYWSLREEAWYLSILNQDDTPIALWIRLVVNWHILRRFEARALVPPGLLLAIDMSGQERDIEVSTDLGTRVVLTYITSDDDTLVGVNLLEPV